MTGYKALNLQPKQGGRPIHKIRLRIQTTHENPDGATTLADIQLQAGGTATGWVPHVTEMPWVAGVVGNG